MVKLKKFVGIFLSLYGGVQHLYTTTCSCEVLTVVAQKSHSNQAAVGILGPLVVANTPGNT